MKNFSQKGQGLTEYALIIGFVGAIALYVMLNGGFGDSVENVIGGASDKVLEASGGNTDDDTSSFDYETLTEEDVGMNFKTLNWQAIDMSIQAMYGTIMKSDTVDKAIKSEVNLFGDLSAMVEGHLASTNKADGLKDWQTFLATMERMQSGSNFKSSYVRGEETLMIQRLGNSNAVQARYSDGKSVVYFRLAPDANNVMQIETNSSQSYSQFMSQIVNRGGWSYAD